ncbi:MAG: NAD(P)-binding domain-containing protein [Deltaproteobacteria bacterium]|nr:NAD(P)-binding domain-containing protein [Deltaproteobacteria bacterium]
MEWALGGFVVVLALATVATVLAIVRRLRGHQTDEAEVESLPEDLKKRVPVSLHPVIDPTICMGSAACVAACPEGRILRLYEGRAQLYQPESCIGHGACARECPVGAIRLVFGTAERGVDIPHVTEHFETNVPGIYIAGELGGMGLIRNAVAQGVQAAAHIAKRPRSKDPATPDLVIVGAGPAGLAAALTARQAGLRFVVVDQEESIGGTVARYPRRKLVMLAPFELPGLRTVRERELSKEDLMALWREVVDVGGIEVCLGETMTGVKREGDAFVVTTSKATHRGRHVLLAIGRRGSPRKLGVPGEALPKVAYALHDAEAYAGLRCLIVGGGDSAIEAALSLSEQAGTTVDVSYRGDTIFRAKPKNRDRLDAAVKAGALRLHLSTDVSAIAPHEAVLQRQDGGEAITLPNDQVFIFAGGVLATDTLADAGIALERKFGTR